MGNLVRHPEGKGVVVGDNVVVKIGLVWGGKVRSGWFGVMKIVGSGVTGEQRWCGWWWRWADGVTRIRSQGRNEEYRQREE